MEEHKKPRVNMKAATPQLFAMMQEISKPTDGIELDPALRELVKVRASQINGCAYCLDLHVHIAREKGISDDRLHLLNAWRDAPGFSDAERVALELTEAVTHIARAGVPEELYRRVREHYSAEEYVGLLAAINMINAWNRFMIALEVPPPNR